MTLTAVVELIGPIYARDHWR